MMRYLGEHGKYMLLLLLLLPVVLVDTNCSSSHRHLIVFNNLREVFVLPCFRCLWHSGGKVSMAV